MGKIYNLEIDKINITEELICLNESSFYIQNWITLISIFHCDIYLGTENAFKITLGGGACGSNKRATLCPIIHRIYVY